MTHFYGTERIGIIVDGANTHAATRAIVMDIDYKRLLAFAAENGRLVLAEYYTAVAPPTTESEFSSLRPLLDWLQYNGWHPTAPVGREGTDQNGRRIIKSGINVEIAVGICRMARNVDHLLLFTGNGDFCPAILEAQRAAVRVSVVSTLRTTPAFVSDDLRRCADQFVDLEELRDVIGRPVEARRTGTDR